jgi:hypothetical protein
LQGHRIEIEQCQIGAVARQSERTAAPDAIRGARDDGYSSFE